MMCRVLIVEPRLDLELGGVEGSDGAWAQWEQGAEGMEPRERMREREARFEGCKGPWKKSI